MVRGERQGQEHKQQKRRLLEIIRTQFSYHIEPWITNTLEKQDSDLKSHLMMMIEHVNNSLKEIQEGAILVEGPKVPRGLSTLQAS